MSRLQALLDEGVAQGAFPMARAVVLLRGEKVFDGGAGGAGVDTVFDLASLTKVMATTAVFLSLWAQGRLTPETLGTPTSATLADFLFHRSGLPAFRPFFAPVMERFPRLFEDTCPPTVREEARREVVRQAWATAPELPPGAAAVYSDVGFILLGDVLERTASRALDELFAQRVAGPLELSARFRRLSTQPALPTSLAPSGTTRPREPAPGQEGLWDIEARPSHPGEVDDDNAWAMDGVAGHAGLFGTAADVARFGQAVLADTSIAPRAKWEALFRRDPTTPGSTRAMGFDTPSDEGSSAGHRLGRRAPGAVGHLGFTGTSLWVDRARELVVALLTNRTALGRHRLLIREFRPRFHDAVFDEFSLD